MVSPHSQANGNERSEVDLADRGEKRDKAFESGELEAFAAPAAEELPNEFNAPAPEDSRSSGAKHKQDR